MFLYLHRHWVTGRSDTAENERFDIVFGGMPRCSHKFYIDESWEQVQSAGTANGEDTHVRDGGACSRCSNRYGLGAQSSPPRGPSSIA